jgi:hypothetical protein
MSKADNLAVAPKPYFTLAAWSSLFVPSIATAVYLYLNNYEKDGEQHVGDQVREALWNERLWFRASTPMDDWLHLNWERKGPGRQTASAAVFKLYPGTNPKGIDLTWKARAAEDFMPQGIDPAWESGQSEKNGGRSDFF